MTPASFIAKWSRSELRERQGAQSHFNDLCALLGEPTPSDADPTRATYCFERGATKVGGGDGWADVWRQNCFGWEYKGKHKDLGAALRQLQIYAPDLDNPPYLVVSDMERIVVHTNWTNTVRRTFTYEFEDLREAAKLDQLRQISRGARPRHMARRRQRSPLYSFDDVRDLPDPRWTGLFARAHGGSRSQNIAVAARKLTHLRETWLNPPDLVPIVPGYPDRILPKDEAAAEILKKRTLINLYNERPTWLANAHRRLDEAVAAAYGWPADLTDDEILARLFALNQERAAAGR